MPPDVVTSRHAFHEQKRRQHHADSYAFGQVRQHRQPERRQQHQAIRARARKIDLK